MVAHSDKARRGRANALGREASPESIVDALLPNETDEPLEDLANTIFLDGDVEVPVSPVDQLLMALARRLLTDPMLGRVGVVQMPRARHRSALLLAICCHLLCRLPPARHDGPVILIAFDVDITDQLRRLGIQHRGRIGLAEGNPLSLHRLTQIGGIRPAVGTAAGDVDESLVYFNTRIGRPQLTCNPPLVVVDATTVARPAPRQCAFEWALDHDAVAVVAIGDLGDDTLIDSVRDLGVVPTVLPITDTVAGNLVHTLGTGKPSSSALSSATALMCQRTDVRLHFVASDDVNDAVSRAFSSLTGRPSGPIPGLLGAHLVLLRNGTRLAARTRDYRTACTYNPRPGEMPALSVLDYEVRLPREWSAWNTTNLGSLTVAVRMLWRALDEHNPKLMALWRVLDQLDAGVGARVLVRCHSRAAAEATRVSLSSGERTPEQQRLWQRLEPLVEFSTLKKRFPAGSFDVQVLTGAPPPWMFSHLLGIEATTTHVLTYEDEAETLSRRGKRWAAHITGWHRAACRTFGSPAAARTESPVPTLETTAASAVARRLQVPGLTLAEILDDAEHAVDRDPEDSDAEGGVSAAGTGGARRCVPVHLADGRTWWCVDADGSTPVLTVTAAGHETRLVGALRAGDRIVVPAGDGTDSIHARLVAASRHNDDVRSLDMILGQFRSAAQAVLEANPTQSAAIARVSAAGAEASGQLLAWATGTTIAPRNPDDVAAVFRAADRPCPDLGLIYAVADRLRGLSRTLGRFVSAIASGGGEQTIDQLRGIVGSVADELLDEFVVAEVDAVGTARLVGASTAGRLR